jgi:segregation and condensation protein A
MQRLVDIIKEPNWKIILFDLVKSNDFDIWDIDLIKLTNAYLNKIKNLKVENLSIPANALLAAAILLKLKAYSLKLTSVEEEVDELIMPKDDSYVESFLNITNPQRIKETQVSLDDLIGVVEHIMNEPTRENITRKIKEKKETVFIIPKKNEDIDIRTNRLFENLSKNIDSEGCIVFSKLISKNLGFDRSQSIVDDYFVPLLFLSQDRKVNIWQDDFFDEIFIKLIV